MKTEIWEIFFECICLLSEIEISHHTFDGDQGVLQDTLIFLGR
jgi:hypothetical protein